MTATSLSGHARVGALNEIAFASSCRVRAIPGFPLIVHADDFGETVEITEGIRQAITAGVVTSTSIMANMPGTRHALQRVPALAELASFGVHLNLCEGRPLTSGLSLADGHGEFHRKRTLFARAMTGRLSLTHVEAEIAAQIALVRDAGVRISHVDGHKHLHQLPVVSAAIANVLPRFAIQRVRITRLGRLGRADKPTAFVREIMAWHAARAFREAGLRSPLRVMDVRKLMSTDAASLPGRSIVDSAGPVELCCHPGTIAADAGKPGSHQRAAELDYLLSLRFRELLSASRARLVSYWDV
jgi:predicted glycoside hydrolase/deacetylase ChbG (UPF0249 family)